VTQDWQMLRANSAIALLSLLLSLEACADHPPSAPTGPATVAAKAAPAADTYEASSYGLFLAGEAAMDDYHLSRAADYFSRAALAGGGALDLQRKAFLAALQSGDVQQAALLAPSGPGVDEQVLRLGLLVRAVESMAEGKYKDAYALLSGPDADSAHSAVTALLAPWAAAGAGNWTGATTAPPDAGDPISAFVAEFDRAQLCERAGKPADAEAAYKALLVGGDAGGLITVAYGAFLERRGRWSDAAALYHAAAARMPSDPEFAAAEARANRRGPAPAKTPLKAAAAGALVVPAAGLLAQKQDQAALAYLRLALRLDPENDDAWVLVGDILSVADADAAREAYAHVGPKSDRYVSARDKLVWSYDNAGDHATALQLAQETAAKAPGRDTTITLAEILRANKDYAQAIATVSKVIDAEQAQPDWRVYYLRASAYQEAGDWPNAEADLKAALRIAPDEPDLLNFLGYSWIDRGEHLHEALAMVQAAASAEPQSGAVIDSLGWGYYRLGDYKQAVDHLEEAVVLDPSDADVNNHLGDAYWRAGRKIEAVYQWKRVLTLEPNDSLRAAAEAKLASPLGPDAPVLTAPSAQAKP